MSLINWSDALSVNNEEIDSQHKKLVNLVNALHDHMAAGDANEVIGKVLDRMIEYTAFHFQTEEKLMEQYKYPGAGLHKIEHKKLVEKALDLQKRFKAGQLQITIEVMNFLRDWLKHPIAESDKLLGGHIARAKGKATVA